jgi:hypothetical protein
MFKFISVRPSRHHRKPVVRPHLTAGQAAATAKALGGVWRELPKAEAKKNIGSGEDYAFN